MYVRFRSATSALILAAILSVLQPTGAEAQTSLPSGSGPALSKLDQNRADAKQLLIEIGSIVSPSGEEHERAERVAETMRAAGLQDVRVTSSPNVVGRIKGQSDGPALVFVSTLDDLATVADHQRASGRPLRPDGDRIVGPGSNTSLTTAAMVSAARALTAAGFRPKRDIVFAAVAQEETGLTGMRALYDEFGSRAGAYVDILGAGETISYGALGIHWWKVTANGPAGHTLRGGLPNVNQGIARAVDAILSLPDAADADRMTRINVAVLNSGKVFNHKPGSGWFSLDIRSLDAVRIASIEADVDRILEQVSTQTGIGLAREAVNLVPGGQIEGALQSPLVRWARAIALSEGKAAELNDSGSANLNIAIAAGTPAIGLGGERGGERGHPGEWASIPALHDTARHVVMLAIAIGSELPPPAAN